MPEHPCLLCCNSTMNCYDLGSLGAAFMARMAPMARMAEVLHVPLEGAPSASSGEVLFVADGRYLIQHGFQCLGHGSLRMTAGAAIRGHFVRTGGQMLGQHFIRISC